jgi:hypothetical protein
MSYRSWINLYVSLPKVQNAVIADQTEDTDSEPTFMGLVGIILITQPSILTDYSVPWSSMAQHIQILMKIWESSWFKTVRPHIG